MLPTIPPTFCSTAVAGSGGKNAAIGLLKDLVLDLSYHDQVLPATHFQLRFISNKLFMCF